MSCFTNKNNKVSCFKDSLASTPCGDIYQAEADYFARCLLMPEAKFRELAEQGYTIDELSQVFIVPKEQVCIRLDELCINGWVFHKHTEYPMFGSWKTTLTPLNVECPSGKVEVN